MLLKDNTVMPIFDVDETDPGKIPRGPRFIEEPQSQIFDLNGRDHRNYVTLRCAADAYPTANYQWFKENYNKTEIVSELVNPLSDPRYTQIYGTSIIHNPKKEIDLQVRYIGQFQLTRSNDFANTNWGKSLSCDPPQHHPRGMFYWVKNVFPNIIGDDRRTFVSSDGNLYFSSVEEVDISLECVAYGYPVPSYNWSRVGVTEQLPDGTSLTSHNRLLIIPKVNVQNSGEYRFSISHSPIIQCQSNLVWTCDAFGIREVKYNWYKNGVELRANTISPEDHQRIKIENNVLTIEAANPNRDAGMYQCRAYNELDNAFSSAQLKISGIKPNISSVPINRHVSLPGLSYQWLFNDSPYRSNSEILSKIHQTKGYLTVFENSSFAEYPRPKIVALVNDTVQLPCDAHSDSKLDIAFIWLHNDIKINQYNN
uniref:Ig-like domain-containing protein n=1 Tax=Tetranychus urticae TaxID=32264 RepID=T1JZ84_TETUR